MLLLLAILAGLLLLFRRHEPESIHRISVFESANSQPSLQTPPITTSPPPPNAADFPPQYNAPCRFEFPPLLPLLSKEETEQMELKRAASGSKFNGIRRLALPPAPAECASHVKPGRVVLRSEVHPRRYLAAFPGGGEVFAIGVPGRMPLRTLSLELAPADDSPSAKDSPWLVLKHAPSNNTLLYVVPPRVDGHGSEGAWMVRLVPRSQATNRGELFCVDPNHGLYSHSANGFVNLRGEVLLRGHDLPNRPAGRIPTSKLTVLRVPDTSLAADDSYWRCAFSGMGSPADTPATGSNGAAVVDSSAASAAAPSLRVLTYATKATPMLCDCLLIALQNKIPLTLIGFGEEYKGNFQKLTGARDVVATLPPNTLVLFADAYDVLYSGGSETLLSGYRKLSVPPSKVLFMGERGCWPDWDMGPPGRKWCLHTYPKSPTPYRYVNSGVWMGRAAAANRLLTVLASYTPGLDDQHVVGHLFVDRNDWFNLDRRSTLLQSMHGNAADVRMERDAAQQPILRNLLTNTTPSVLHFNGGAKDQFPRWRDHLLSSGGSCLPVGSGEIDAPGGPLKFRTVCPRHPLPRGARAC